MASGDIYEVKVNCSSNNRAWSFGGHLLEQTPQNPENDGRVVARAVNDHILAAMRGVLTMASFMESVQAWRRFPTTSMPGFVKTGLGTGALFGNTMSNDNALYLDFRQSAGDAKFNGGAFIAGMSEAETEGNEFRDTFIEGAVQDLADVLQGFVNAVSSDTGQWQWVVLSKSFTPPATNIGTALDVTSVVPTARVMTQRRRRQKSQGFSQ